MTGVLEWTGHALVDVGMAAVCAMVGKNDPGELTLEDLDQAANEMEEYYFSGLMGSYLTCVFMNAEYVQPGTGPKKAESRKKYAQRVLYAHRCQPEPDAEGRICVFSGRPATHLIHRGQMPLLTGEGVLNFYPACIGALAISGPYLTALQALPLGGRRTEGKLLIGHSDSASITLDLASLYLEDNRRLLALGKAGSLPAKDGPDLVLDREQGAWDAKKKQAKYPDAKSASSLIANDLIQIWDQKGLSATDVGNASVTVYWLSSSGQGPSLEIYPLPSNLLRFLVRAGELNTKAQWKRLVARGWVEPGREKEREPLESQQVERAQREKVGAVSVLGGAGRSRNEVLSDLFRLYENGFLDLDAARRFLRRHILTELKGSIRFSQDCNWALAELFLMEVFGMDKERIDAVRSFADRLAEHIQTRNDKGLFRELVYAKRSGEFRNALTKAQRNEARSNNQLLFGLDEYLKVFEAEDSVGRLEWGLIRDLISIRLVEQLQKAGFLSKEMLTEEEQQAAVSS